MNTALPTGEILSSHEHFLSIQSKNKEAGPHGRLMVDSITIRNFRSFSEGKLEDCRRVNILVGENGSGKTALLEALFLAAGISPELAIRTRSWRGFDSDRISGSQEDVHQALWGDLFHKFQTNRSAVVALRGRGEQTRSVEILLHRQDRKKVIPPSRDRPSDRPQVVRRISPFQFRYKIGDQKPFEIEPYLEGEKLVYPQGPGSHIKAVFFAANRMPSSSDMSSRFSELSRTFQADLFIERFRELYPRIKNLSIEVSAGTPMLFASVDEIPAKIPITLASGGMSKLAAILLAMPDQSGGLVLIDEMENGLYHRGLPFIWKALYQFAQWYECQLFLSTHSAECLAAAASLAQENPHDFSVIRTVLEGGETKLRHFGGDKFVEALEEQIDIR